MVIKKIKPMYTRLITTMNKYVEDQKDANGLVDVAKLKQGIQEYQTVISVGTNVRNVKEGDLVCINPSRYAVKQYSENSMKSSLLENQTVRYNFNVVNIDGKDCLLLDENDIEFVIEDYEN